MNVEASTTEPLATDADTIAVGVFEGEDPAPAALTGLLESGEGSRKFKRTAITHAEGRRFILVGLGERDRFDSERARAAAAVAHRRARELSSKVLCWAAPPHTAAALVEGTLLHAYRFDRYKKREDARELDRLILSAAEDVSEAVREAAIITAAVNRARDLGNTPANDLPPAALADYAEELAARHGFTAQILDGAAIRERGMGAFAAVAQGSQQDPRLIRLDYEGAGADGAPRLGMVGKAVTFDSGGLSLKPARSMHEMKFDMCGGAAVIEAVAALAELRAPVRVLAVVGATENMPSGTAVKPGDIVRAFDGTTIEVNNTDAEGRLVLGDCLTYAIREGAERLIDLATLTGGVVTALGHTYAGFMANDDAWARAVEEASAVTGELVWRLPLHEDFAEMVKGRVAQLTNLPARTGASSIVGGEFLHHFVGDTPWAHLDIAGTAYDARSPYLDRAATGLRGPAAGRPGARGRGVAPAPGPAPRGGSINAKYRGFLTHPSRSDPDHAQDLPQQGEAAFEPDPAGGHELERGPAARVDRVRPALYERRHEQRDEVRERPLDAHVGGRADSVLDEYVVLTEHDPDGRVTVLDRELHHRPECSRRGGAPAHPAVDDSEDRRCQTARKQLAQPNLGRLDRFRRGDGPLLSRHRLIVRS